MAVIILLPLKSQAVTVEEFSKHPQFYNVKISPDGKHLAVLLDNEGRKTLAFLETDTKKVTYSLHNGNYDQAGRFYWVNNERVITQIQRVTGRFEGPMNTGELYAINYDGKKKKMIAGYRSKGKSPGGSFLLDGLTGDDQHILVQKHRRSGGQVIPRAVKLNVYTGREYNVKKAPMSDSSFLVDHSGTPRFSIGVDKDHLTQVYYTKGKDDDWVKFGEDIEGKFEAITFAKDNNTIYALQSKDGGPKGLYEYDIATKKSTLLYQSKLADPSIIFGTDLNQLYGIQIDEDYPQFQFFASESTEAQLHKSLLSAFKGETVYISSITADKRKAVVHVSGDRNPGEFYLYDTQTNKAEHLLSSHSWIDKSKLAPTEPFRIKTPDGLVLNGYLTLPVGKTSNLPTVVIPHGGPHTRDYWGYNAQVQLLASKGYAVVQVNFRGSTGYGESFKEAGYKQWGAKIQDDILLATQYAVQTGVADKDRLCIFGASFGGYSALQASIREPDTFKCSIGYVGVYDLAMLYKEGDIKDVKWGDAYLDKTLGTDKAELISQSPVHNIDKLKTPVLIIHGEDDNRAHFEHALALKEVLDKEEHPYEWLVKDKEGHGFYKEENIIEANHKILAFLDKYIGH
ncbi:S9 family peptidase [Shewanella sp. KX20019]|nr:S9 family peptidase [Shewanella sp. KX20019]